LRLTDTVGIMDPVNPNQKVRSTPQYALYQRENFWKSNEGEVPLFNTGEYDTYLVRTLITHG